MKPKRKPNPIIKWRLLESNEIVKKGDEWKAAFLNHWYQTTERTWGENAGTRKIRRKVTPTKRGSIKINPPPKPQRPIVRFLKRWLREITGIYW